MEPVVAVETLPAAALVCAADDRVTALNARAAALFAAPAEALAGASLTDLFPDDPDVGERLRRAGGTPVRAHARRRTGVPVTLEVLTAAGPGGALTCLLTDVVAARLSSEAHRYLAAAFEHLPIGMALFNGDGEYLRANRALCRLLGRPADELLGRRDQEFTHPDDRAADVEAAWRILRGELDVWQTEKRFLRADGAVVWVL